MTRRRSNGGRREQATMSRSQRRAFGMLGRVVTAAAIVGALLASYPGPVSAQASSGSDIAPGPFAAAVLGRLNLMYGTPGASITPGATFANLQYDIGSTATDYSGTYVDPATGNPWILATLLQEASGQSTWLADSAGTKAQEQQITSVLGAMGWRLAAYTAADTLTSTTPTTYIAGNSCATDPKTGLQIGTPSLRQQWQQQFTQALAGTWEFTGGTIGTAAEDAGGAGASVSIGRGVVNAVLPQASQSASGLPSRQGVAAPWLTGAAVPGVAVDGARFVIEVAAEGTGGSLPGRTSGASPWDAGAGDIAITGGAGVDNLHFEPSSSYAQPQPTKFGTFTPQRIPGISNGYVMLNVATSFLFEPGHDALHPVFKPAVLIQLTAQEPPPGWPSSTDLGVTCVDSKEWYIGDAQEAFKGEGVPVIYHEDFPPLTVTTVHIGTAQLSGMDRVQALKGEYTSQVGALNAEKETLATLLPQEQRRMASDEAAMTSFGATIVTLQAKIAEAKSYVAQITSAEKKLSPAVQELLASRDALGENILQTQDQILAAQHAGNTAKANALQRTLASEQAALAEDDRQLAGKAGEVGDLLGLWMAELRKLQGQLFTAQSGQATAQFQLMQDEVAVQNSSTRQDNVDNQLLNLDQSLTNLDFEVQHVSVYADGNPVFGAVLKSPFAQIEAWDDLIAKIKAYLPVALARRQTALAEFKAAEHSSIIALQTVEAAIRSNSYKKAGVDAAFYAWDLAWATSKGGVAGLGTELAKKAAEAVIGLVSYSLDKEGGATEFNKAYTASLTQVMGVGPAFLPPGKALSVALQKVAKEATLKPAKDALNYQIGKYIIQKVWGETPALYLQGISSPPSLTGVSAARLVQEFKTFWSGFRDSGLQLKNLVKTTKFSDRVKDVGVGALKDISKAALKAYIDTAEQLAWSNYFYSEVVAQTYFPLWQLATDEYWSTKDALEAAQTTRDVLAAGYNPATGTKVVLDVPFSSGATLTLALGLVRSVWGPAPLKIGVNVAGAAATLGIEYHYALSSSGLTEGPQGLGLIVKADY